MSRVLIPTAVGMQELLQKCEQCCWAGGEDNKRMLRRISVFPHVFAPDATGSKADPSKTQGIYANGRADPRRILAKSLKTEDFV